MVLATARREAEEPGRDREMGEGGGEIWERAGGSVVAADGTF